MKKQHPTWWWATGALTFATLLFLTSLLILKGNGYSTLWAGIKAFSEAAMVGALADWFAVTALFRHPMGLPIPHTAVLVTGRQRVANSSASFIADNFLTSEIIKQKILALKPTYQLAKWCITGNNSDKIMSYVASLAPQLRDFLESDTIREFIGEKFRELVQSFPLADTSSHILDGLRKTDIPDKIVQILATESVEFVEANQASLNAQIAEQLPIPAILNKPLIRPLGNLIAPLVLKKLINYLKNVSEDPNHPLRLQIREKMLDSATNLKTNPDYIQAFDQAKNSFLTGDLFMDTVSQIMNAVISGILGEGCTPGTADYEKNVTNIRKLFTTLIENEQVPHQMDEIISEFAAQSITQGHDYIRTELEQIVMNWDIDIMIEKVEEQVGNDLQFIRINGTVVGGIIGILLFFITWLF